MMTKRHEFAVITGSGDALSAGGDLEWIESFRNDYAAVRNVMREAGDIVYRMLRCEKVIISAINGVAVGAGLAVGLMADISLMAREARFSDGHLRLGVGAGDHAVLCWPLLCGLAKAKYYLLTSDFIDGDTADRIGLVSKAVDRADLLDEAMKVATKIASGPQECGALDQAFAQPLDAASGACLRCKSGFRDVRVFRTRRGRRDGGSAGKAAPSL